MAYIGTSAAGGLVDETTQLSEVGKPVTMGCFVANLGQASTNYSGIIGISQPAQGNQTFIGILCAGSIIRFCDISQDGSVSITHDVQRSSLSSTQLQLCHLALSAGQAHRQGWIDGVSVWEDTTPQTATQYATTLGIGYGLSGPVSVAKVQLLSGYGGASDVARMKAGQDVRDVALANRAGLSAVRQFLRKNDLTEDTGLFGGFLLNSNGVYQRQLEVDVSPTPTFDSTAIPYVAWSGNGAVKAARSVTWF